MTQTVSWVVEVDGVRQEYAEHLEAIEAFQTANGNTVKLYRMERTLLATRP